MDSLLHELPDHLAERVRRLEGAATPQPGAELVVYWMRTAVRAEENPALDVACWLAVRLELPLLVYHALSERYPYASDRHHTFVLEGARDVAAALVERGLRHAFHLEREGARGPYLKTLAERAALVVTEDMPIAFLEAWARRLAQGPAPVLAVDTACLVPMNAVTRLHTRAFQFRSATQRERRARLGRPWPELELLPRAYEGELPFAPLDLASADVPSLVASCRIDHSVAPTPGTRGGSQAGYARWDRFRREGLDRYAARRNDPLKEGVSRLSAYLHYGMVSPLRIAREAHERGGKGAEKYLDELLIWRELAYSFCRHVPEHESLSALPEWALATLRAHGSDPRPALLDEETLERARSGDPLWDAAQASLRIHGELHNNVRMTWGKALLRWTLDAATALRRLIDLNHRFALDGRDPASYGGILWCLGQFDRPFLPGTRILGEVRDRKTQDHARRLDVRAYAASCHAPALDPSPRALVIGAGLAGLICARTLRDHGLEVDVLSAGRGRCATHQGSDGRFAFDPGLQYLDLREPRLARWVAAWREQGLLQPWSFRRGYLDNQGRLTRVLTREVEVAVPSAAALPRHLARDLRVERAEVRELLGGPRRWRVRTADGEERGPYTWVLVATPHPVAARLLAPHAPALAERIEAARSDPALAYLYAPAGPLSLDFDGATVEGSPVSWIAHDSLKPARPEATCLVAHAAPAWGSTRRGADPAEVQVEFRAELERLLGPLPPARYEALERWEVGLIRQPVGEECLFAGELGLGVCGDYLLGHRAEHALASGVALAGRALGRAAASRPVRVSEQTELFA